MVITSNIHGCLEAVVQNESGYLVEKKNVISLYEAMKKFTLLSYEERLAMGIRSRKHMEMVFDKKKCSKRNYKRNVKIGDIYVKKFKSSNSNI